MLLIERADLIAEHIDSHDKEENEHSDTRIIREAVDISSVIAYNVDRGSCDAGRKTERQASHKVRTYCMLCDSASNHESGCKKACGYHYMGNVHHMVVVGNAGISQSDRCYEVDHAHDK